jgi:hypothetical protein
MGLTNRCVLLAFCLTWVALSADAGLPVRPAPPIPPRVEKAFKAIFERAKTTEKGRNWKTEIRVQLYDGKWQRYHTRLSGMTYAIFPTQGKLNSHVAIIAMRTCSRMSDGYPTKEQARNAPFTLDGSYAVTSRSYRWSDTTGKWTRFNRTKTTLKELPTAKSLKGSAHWDECDTGHIVRANDPHRWDLGYTRIESIKAVKRLTWPTAPPKYDVTILASRFTARSVESGTVASAESVEERYEIKKTYQWNREHKRWRSVAKPYIRSYRWLVDLGCWEPVEDGE